MLSNAADSGIDRCNVFPSQPLVPFPNGRVILLGNFLSHLIIFDGISFSSKNFIAVHVISMVPTANNKSLTDKLSPLLAKKSPALSDSNFHNDLPNFFNPTAPSIVARLLALKLLKKVFKPFRMSPQLKSEKKPVAVFQNPSTQPLIASAHCFHLNLRKNLLNPCARFVPSVLKSNLSVNPLDAKIAVLSAVAVNTLFPFLSSENRPFKKLANPVPNLSAFL